MKPLRLVTQLIPRKSPNVSRMKGQFGIVLRWFALVPQPVLARWSMARWGDYAPFLVIVRGVEDQEEPRPVLVSIH